MSTRPTDLATPHRAGGPPQPGPRPTWLKPRSGGLRAARGAFILGLLYAAVSVYWGLGGTGLLDTLGGSLERQGNAGTTTVMLAVWAAAVLKMIAAVLPLLARHRFTRAAWNRTLSVLAWTEAAILTTYGLVLSTVGPLVQADVIRASANADHHALAWHAYFWDPWFLIWGLLVTVALVLHTRHRRSQAAAHG